MQWNFDIHALLNRSGAEVGNQDLQDADMTHDRRKSKLLLNVNDNGVETIDQVAVAFSTRESGIGNKKEMRGGNVCSLFQIVPFLTYLV